MGARLPPPMPEWSDGPQLNAHPLDRRLAHAVSMLHLHVVPGDAAARCLQEALGASARVASLGDSLSCGPLPPLAALADWTALRERFWRAIVLEESAATLRPRWRNWLRRTRSPCGSVPVPAINSLLPSSSDCYDSGNSIQDGWKSHSSRRTSLRGTRLPRWAF